MIKAANQVSGMNICPVMQKFFEQDSSSEIQVEPRIETIQKVLDDFTPFSNEEL